jgi:hypothetical protein
MHKAKIREVNYIDKQQYRVISIEYSDGTRACNK